MWTIFQQDRASCHTSNETINLLSETFGERIISHRGPVAWPQRSEDRKNSKVDFNIQRFLIFPWSVICQFAEQLFISKTKTKSW